MSIVAIETAGPSSIAPYSSFLSFARNGAYSIKSAAAIPAVATVLSGATILNGVMGIPVSAQIMHDAYQKGKIAWRCGDSEGIAMQALYGNIGLTYAGISGLMSANGILGVQGMVAPAAMGAAFAGLGFGMYAAVLGYNAYGLGAACKFSNALEVAKKEGNALDWIKKQVTLSDLEQQLPEGQKTKLLQKKQSAFEFRTSSDCLKVVLNGIQNKGDAHSLGLIAEVEKANYKTKVKRVMLIVIALLGFATCIGCLILSAPVSAALFAACAILWFAVDSSRVQSYITEKCWNLHVRGTKGHELNFSNSGPNGPSPHLEEKKKEPSVAQDTAPKSPLPDSAKVRAGPRSAWSYIISSFCCRKTPEQVLDKLISYTDITQIQLDSITQEFEDLNKHPSSVSNEFKKAAKIKQKEINQRQQSISARL